MSIYPRSAPLLRLRASPPILSPLLHLRPSVFLSPIGTTRGFQTVGSSHAPQGFEYKIAAAFSGKKNVFDQQKHHYLFDAETDLGSYGDADLGKRGRKIPSGQDSFFVGPVGDYSTRTVAFAVADGVGGYKDSGIDSADFAHGICKYMKVAASEHRAQDSTTSKPLKVLQDGYDKVCSDADIEGGGSTACVAVAHRSGTLDVAKSVSNGTTSILTTIANAKLVWVIQALFTSA